MKIQIFLLSIISLLFVALLYLQFNSNVSAIELTPFVPTNTPVRTATPTSTVFIQPWHTPTRTPTKTPHPDCGVLINCETPISNS